ncbi:MAG TPA: hypothetical protein VF167_02625 [Longimicrobiaceae bacterium]
MSIRLHIERLVLDGFELDAAQGPALQAAVQAEVSRLLMERGLGDGYRQSGALAYVRGADFQVPASAAPEPLGREIGAAVHRSLLP